MLEDMHEDQDYGPEATGSDILRSQGFTVKEAA